MKFDLSGIEFSRMDNFRKVRLPEETSDKLAEFIGILAGDGHVSFSKPYNAVAIAGDSRLDKEYLGYVRGLIKDLFNLDVNIEKRNNQNLAMIQFSSMAIVSFLKINGYYKHKSTDIKIPKWILNDNSYFINMLKGLADTDFSLMVYKNRKIYPHYPIVSLTLKDRDLIILIYSFLKKEGFNPYIRLDEKRFEKRFKNYCITHKINLSGRQNLYLWMELIGFRNKRHLDKYYELINSGSMEKKLGRPQLIIKRNKKSGSGGI